jgi:hypothetical protein
MAGFVLRRQFCGKFMCSSLRINICGENGHIRQARKRYQPYDRELPQGLIYLIISHMGRSSMTGNIVKI